MSDLTGIEQYKIKDYDQKLKATKSKTAVTGYDVSSLRFALSHYGGRLLATAGCWLANDFVSDFNNSPKNDSVLMQLVLQFFYGNKLFQSSFIEVVVGPEASTKDSWLYNLINIGVSLVGYYLAAFLVDAKWYGRKHLQGVGFICVFICFIIPAFDFGPIQTKGGIHAFQALY